MNLFSEAMLGTIKVKNHFVRSATSEGKATATGHMTTELLSIYQQLAEGSVGAIITGFANITEQDQPSSNMMGIYDDTFIAEYKHLTNTVHQHGTPILMQLVYGGFVSQGDHGSSEVWGPSTMLHPKSGVQAKEMSISDMEACKAAFSAAAKRAKEAGFDGIQLHAAHGYLLSQFLSPQYNKREDCYGGNIENRTRFLIEVYEAVKAEVGSDYPIWVKINSSDGIDGGLTATDSLIASQMLAATGINAIEVSGGNMFQVPKSEDSEAYFKSYAIELASRVNIPVILTGGNRSLSVMQKIADSTKVTFFGFSRPLFKNPRFINDLNL